MSCVRHDVDCSERRLSGSHAAAVTDEGGSAQHFSSTAVEHQKEPLHYSQYRLSQPENRESVLVQPNQVQGQPNSLVWCWKLGFRRMLSAVRRVRGFLILALRESHGAYDHYSFCEKSFDCTRRVWDAFPIVNWTLGVELTVHLFKHRPSVFVKRISGGSI